MKYLVAGCAGAMLCGIVYAYLYEARQYEINAIVSRAQGKVDVMIQYCKPELEKAGLVNKEKQNEK